MTPQTLQKGRKVMVLERLEVGNVRVLFLQSLCTDLIVDVRSILESKLSFPNYRNADPRKAFSDSTKPIQQYEVARGSGNNTKRCSYVKIATIGRELVPNNIQRYMQGKDVGYLLDSHVMLRIIYTSWHGQRRRVAIKHSVFQR